MNPDDPHSKGTREPFIIFSTKNMKMNLKDNKLGAGESSWARGKKKKSGWFRFAFSPLFLFFLVAERYPL